MKKACLCRTNSEKFLQFDTRLAVQGGGKPSSEYLRLLLFIFPCLVTYNVERMPDRISVVELEGESRKKGE